MIYGISKGSWILSGGLGYYRFSEAHEIRKPNRRGCAPQDEGASRNGRAERGRLTALHRLNKGGPFRPPFTCSGRSCFHIYMFLSSYVFNDGEAMPAKFTCEGWDVNPELSISNVPINAKSLALLFEDIDSKDGPFTHWLLWNISPGTVTIKEESIPPGSLEGLGSSGREGYLGPCPKVGEHRYFFRLFALDSILGLAPGSSRADFDSAIQGHVLEKADLSCIYKLNK